jgi:hypothetical protein
MGRRLMENKSRLLNRRTVKLQRTARVEAASRPSRMWFERAITRTPALKSAEYLGTASVLDVLEDHHTC